MAPDLASFRYRPEPLPSTCRSWDRRKGEGGPAKVGVHVCAHTHTPCLMLQVTTRQCPSEMRLTRVSANEHPAPGKSRKQS